MTKVTLCPGLHVLPHAGGVLEMAAPGQLLFMIHQEAGERGKAGR